MANGKRDKTGPPTGPPRPQRPPLPAPNLGSLTFPPLSPPQLTWYEAVGQLEPHVVRISTPGGSGTGFLVAHSAKSSVCGIATAAHVVHHAHFWEEPIRIDHTKTGGSVVVHHTERAVLMDLDTDTAVIIVDRGSLGLPNNAFPLMKKGFSLKVGNEIGWLGYPVMSPNQACFFAGHISSWIADQHAYLVDGVAINGVSGGPAFGIIGTAELQLIGVVTAYVPSRATGELLPGLAMIRDVERFHDVVERFASLDQAKEEEVAPPAPPPVPPEGGTLTGRK